MQINVLEYLEKTCESYSDKVGFEDKNITLTFSEFRKKALNISTNIVCLTSKIRRPIGVFLPKSVNALISFAGILYSGNFYVPLDVKNPKERLVSIFGNIEPLFVITDQENIKKLQGIIPDDKIILFEEAEKDVTEIKKRYEEVLDSDPAYIINTSGSTGVPKGVVISHHSIIDYIDWAVECYKMDKEAVIANQAPFYFDNSVLDIYLCFATGAKLILTPEELFIFPIKLLQFMSDKQVNQIFWVPSILVNIANMKLLDSVKPNLKKILFAGEVMPTKQLNYWIKVYPDAVFSNLYGPTEITVDCTYYTVDRKFADNEQLPIGVPCRNSDILVLDENNNLITEANISGELCVRGSSLALGYYNNFDKTNAVFIQNPLNNKYPERIYKTGDIVHYNEFHEIIFEGRRDFQIKHMGYRIELGEIETALGAVTEFKNICVVYDNSRSKIVLFYVADKEIMMRDIILTIGNAIPKYMIPSELHKLEALPINANGKIDRKKLTQMAAEY